jgi:hypothetical protein
MKIGGPLIILLLLVQTAQSQRFGGNPPSLKWMQIRTDTVQVIFPVGLDSLGQRVAGLTHYLNRKTGYSIGPETRKISIVLQNQTTLSNGYVGLAPWRSEFYLTPIQNSLQLGSLPWVDQLAIHEYRHVQQYTNFRKGVARFAWFVAGEQGQGLMNALTVPDWFFEGDAVFQETAVTLQGRGRLPDFFNGYRSIWQEGRHYSYQKLRNGSYRHLVPSHYPLGYMLVAYGRERYGPSFWKQVTSDAVRLRPFFYPLQGAVRKHSGESFEQFTQNAFRLFRDSSLQDSKTPEIITTPDKRFVKNYEYPLALGPDSILVLKETYRHIPAWYLVNAKGEQRLRTRDIAVDGFHAQRNGKLIYTAWRPGLRWSWQDFSDIRIWDMKEDRQRRITTRSRYFSPDLSPDESQVVAVDVRKDGSSRLHLLSPENGSLIREFENPEGYFHTYPCFSQDGKGIYTAVRNQTGQMAIIRVEKDLGQSRVLVPFSYRPISFLRVRGKYLLFTASYNRKDVVWAFDESDGGIIELSGSYTGLYMADLDTVDRKLAFSIFRADGMMLAREPFLERNRRSPAQWASDPADLYAMGALLQERASVVYPVDGTHPWQVNGAKYPVKSYRSSTRLFNFHSWRPWYEQPNWTLSAFSENVLNTFRSDLYYNYNQNEGFHKFGFNGTYGGWFPWVTGGVSYTIDRFVSDGPLNSNISRQFQWNEFNANLGLRVPLNFSGGRHYRFLTVASSFNTQQLDFQQTSSGKPENQGYQYIQSSLTWSMQVQQARQHIFPRFAHAIRLQYRAGVADLKSTQFLASADLYLPGLHMTHNLVLNGSWQSRDTLGQYFFTNNFARSRGYPGVDFPRMGRVSANYHFPLFYPDWGFGNILYFLRLRANVYYDYSAVKSLRSGISTPLRSTGMELYFDTRLWNQQPISFGIRYARLLDADAFQNQPGANQWEFILPLNLIPN